MYLTRGRGHNFGPAEVFSQARMSGLLGWNIGGDGDTREGMTVQDLEQLYTTIWFDPGGTTGWGLVSVFPEALGPEPMEAWTAARLVLDAAGEPSMTPEEAAIAWEAERAEAAAYRIVDNIVFWSAGQFIGRRDQQVDAMLGLVEAWPVVAPIGNEDFTLRALRMDESLLEPVRVTAAFEVGLRDIGREPGDTDLDTAGLPKWRGRGQGRICLKQQPALAMTHLPDDRLRLLRDGEFVNATAGRPHARDAIRHALTFLRREKEARASGKTLEIPPQVILD